MIAENFIGKHVIVRGDRSGVFFGKLVERDGQECLLDNVRRLWYWDGAASLSELAENGVTKPATCKFPVSVHKILVLDAKEILLVSKKAKKSIDGVKNWTVA